mgnify:CR=1 FL=1
MHLFELLAYIVFSVIITLTLLPWLVTLSCEIEDLTESSIITELYLTSWSSLLGIFIFIRNKRLYLRPILGNHILSNPKKNIDTSANKLTNSESNSDIANIKNTHQKKNIDHSDLFSKTEKTRNFESKRTEFSQSSLQKLYLFKPLLLDLLQSIRHMICLQQVSIKGKMGMSNPMQTGIIYGIQQIASSLMSNRIKIELTPSFSPLPLPFNGKIEIKLQLYSILFFFFMTKFIIHLFYLNLRDKLGKSVLKPGKVVN